jgi:Uma2 family endonuclease
MTESQFVAWCDADTRAEWVNGEVILMSPVNWEHGDLVQFLTAVLRTFVEEGDLGRTQGLEYQVRFAEIPSRRVPDLLFVSKDRMDLAGPDHFEGAPDLVVEIVSPDSTARDWREKYHEYESVGVREYWVVDPQHRRVEAYELAAGKRYRLIPEKEGVIRSRVLRGFFLKPAWLWPPRPKVRAVLKELGVV